ECDKVRIIKNGVLVWPVIGRDSLRIESTADEAQGCHQAEQHERDQHDQRSAHGEILSAFRPLSTDALSSSRRTGMGVVTQTQYPDAGAATGFRSVTYPPPPSAKWPWSCGADIATL